MAVRRKTGGRQKGTPNKSTSARVAAIVASGITPLDYMLTVMRDETAELAERLDAARSAAPYVHPRLASMELRHDASDAFARLWRHISETHLSDADATGVADGLGHEPGQSAALRH